MNALLPLGLVVGIGVMALSVRAPAAEREETAVFAGGCFWCMEPPFEKMQGVKAVVSGYTGGVVENPTYEQVSDGVTGHLEAVQVVYDPAQVSYEQLLEVFWRQVDPTDAGGQFVDRGDQYRSAIFVKDDVQRKLAEASKKKLEKAKRYEGKPIATQVVALGRFWPAEEYHQDYYKKNPVRYKYYRWGSGRDEYLEKTWGKGAVEAAPGPGKASWHDFRKPPEEELRKRLTPLQYEVTQANGTEPPHRNEYADNHREGIYVDIVSGEPLFSSRDKYESGTGWPSFSRPMEPGNIIEREDRNFLSVRTEVRSRHADSHLGHVFPDGPASTGKRYCMNSAALRFVPKEEMEKEGYGDYLLLFGK